MLLAERPGRAAFGRARPGSSRSVVTRPPSPKPPRFLVGQNETHPAARARPRGGVPALGAEGLGRVLDDRRAAAARDRRGLVHRARSRRRGGRRGPPACAPSGRAPGRRGRGCNEPGARPRRRARAPERWMAPAVAKNVYAGHTTSSPAPTPSAISATSSASVPEETPSACRTPRYAGRAPLEGLDLRTEDVVAAARTDWNTAESSSCMARSPRARSKKGTGGGHPSVSSWGEGIAVMARGRGAGPGERRVLVEIETTDDVAAALASDSRSQGGAWRPSREATSLWTVAAHPAGAPGRHAGDERIVGHVA